MSSDLSESLQTQIADLSNEAKVLFIFFGCIFLLIEASKVTVKNCVSRNIKVFEYGKDFQELEKQIPRLEELVKKIHDHLKVIFSFETSTKSRYFEASGETLKEEDKQAEA